MDKNVEKVIADSLARIARDVNLISTIALVGAVLGVLWFIGSLIAVAVAIG